MKNIVLVEDDWAFNDLLRKFLTSQGYAVQSVINGDRALELLKAGKPDLVLTDYRLPGYDGLELTQRIKELHPELPVILITNYADVRTAVRSIKIGAFDFVSKPIIPDELLKIIALALNSDASSDRVKTSQALQVDHNNYVIGQNAAMNQLWQHLELVSPTQMNVVIYGESGTGKEQLARSLHALSRRSSKPFIAVDCGALATELAASELFGHAKGAFTGAHAAKIGLFEQSDGGTLFLDEIGNLPYEIQVALLRVVQEGRVRRVGETTDIQVNVRLVAATNEPLNELIVQGKFRNDLYHRLNEFELHIPPLRDRLVDLQAYCDHFVEAACNEFNKPHAKLSDTVLDVFHAYTWPGNLRELKNIIRRAVVLSSGEGLTTQDLPSSFKTSIETDDNVDQVKSGLQNESPATALRGLKSHNQAAEKQLILDALELSRFNKKKTAEYLGIDRSTLYKKMKQHGIAM